jgi:hypothetical protein
MALIAALWHLYGVSLLREGGCRRTARTTAGWSVARDYARAGNRRGQQAEALVDAQLPRQSGGAMAQLELPDAADPNRCRTVAPLNHRGRADRRSTFRRPARGGSFRLEGDQEPDTRTNSRIAFLKLVRRNPAGGTMRGLL